MCIRDRVRNPPAPPPGGGPTLVDFAAAGPARNEGGRAKLRAVCRSSLPLSGRPAKTRRACALGFARRLGFACRRTPRRRVQRVRVKNLSRSGSGAKLHFSTSHEPCFCPASSTRRHANRHERCRLRKTSVRFALQKLLPVMRAFASRRCEKQTSTQKIVGSLPCLLYTSDAADE